MAPYLVEGKVLIRAERRALRARQQRAQQSATLTVVARKGIAPAVASERDGPRTVQRGQLRVLPFRVDHHGSSTTLQRALELHFDNGALAGTDGARDDDVGVGHQARA